MGLILFGHFHIWWLASILLCPQPLYVKNLIQHFVGTGLFNAPILNGYWNFNNWRVIGNIKFPFNIIVSGATQIIIILSLKIFVMSPA